MIKTVTLTGADNSIRPAALAAISHIYPFVEWGILVSRRSMGRNRFPDMEWLQELAALKSTRPDLKLSCHLCGGFVDEILMGDAYFIYNEIGEDIFAIFERVQINTHGVQAEFDAERMIHLMNNCTGKEFIFQFDNANEQILEAARAGGVNCSTLFDMSHGEGVLPGRWPLPLSNVKCGYAGGLSPENLKVQIELIEDKVGVLPIWIDAETHVRSDDGRFFSLEKVQHFLSIAEERMKSMVIPQRGVVVLTEAEQDFANHVGYEVKLLDGGTGINMGLYFPETWAEDGILKANGVNVFFPEKNKIYVQNFNQVELIFPNGISRMNQSEALFGFISWLTTRSQPVTLSGKHEASTAVELINIFMKVNNLPMVRENWTDYLVGMGKHEQPVNTMGVPHSKHNSSCLDKAEDDEPIFVILGRDSKGPETVMAWIKGSLRTQPFSKLFDAMKVVEEMSIYQMAEASSDEANVK